MAATETKRIKLVKGAKIDVKTMPETREVLVEADRIAKIAFGDYLNRPPDAVWGDASYLSRGWRAPPGVSSARKWQYRALGVYVDGKLVGLNYITVWGRYGYFGPLAILPEYQGNGLAIRLLDATESVFSDAGVTAPGLYTFPNSPKHLHLYGKFGYHPYSLTVGMEKAVKAGADSTAESPAAVRRYSQLSSDAQAAALRGARSLLGTHVFEGMDASEEIVRVLALGLGDTFFLYGGDAKSADETHMVGVAILQTGKGTEGGSKSVWVKLAAANSRSSFVGVLRAAMDIAVSSFKGAEMLALGINMACEEAFDVARQEGFKMTKKIGVSMSKRGEKRRVFGKGIYLAHRRT